MSDISRCHMKEQDNHASMRKQHDNRSWHISSQLFPTKPQSMRPKQATSRSISKHNHE